MLPIKRFFLWVILSATPTAIISMSSLKLGSQSKISTREAVHPQTQEIYHAQQQRLYDFMAVMGALHGMPCQVAGDKKKPIELQNGYPKEIPEIVYEYLNTIELDTIPFSPGQPVDPCGPKKLDALCILASCILGNGNLVGSYYQSHVKDHYYANIIQRYSVDKGEWTILYKHEPNPLVIGGKVLPATRLCVLRNGMFALGDHLFRQYVKIIDPKARLFNVQKRLYNPPENPTNDLLELSNSRLLVAGTGGGLTVFDLRKNEKKVLAEETGMRSSRGSMQLVPLLDGFVSYNPGAITRWVIESNTDDIWKLQSFEFPRARILACAVDDTEIVCVVEGLRTNDEKGPLKSFAVFFDHELKKVGHKQVDIVPLSRGRVIKFKDGSLGVLAKKYYEYTKKQAEDINIEGRLHCLKVAEGKQAQAINEPVWRPVHDTSPQTIYIVPSDCPLYDFALVDRDGAEGIAALLFYRYGNYVKQLFDRYIKPGK